MGELDGSLFDHNKKSKSPVLAPKNVPSPISSSSKRLSDIHIPSPNHALSVASSEQFEKSGLVEAHLAALHDSTILEMGYQVTECEHNTSIQEQAILKAPSLGNLEDFKALKSICLKDLKVGKVHRGRILSGKLCCKSVKALAIMNVLEEDDTGYATRLTVANFVPSSATTTQIQQLYPKGAHLSIQEPYLKRFADGMVGLLVEYPADIIFNYLPQEMPVPESSINSKEELPSNRRFGELQQHHGESEGHETLSNNVSYGSLSPPHRPSSGQLTPYEEEEFCKCTTNSMNDGKGTIDHQLGESQGSSTTHERFIEAYEDEEKIIEVDNCNGNFEKEEIKTLDVVHDHGGKSNCSPVQNQIIQPKTGIEVILSENADFSAPISDEGSCLNAENISIEEKSVYEVTQDNVYLEGNMNSSSILIDFVEDKNIVLQNFTADRIEAPRPSAESYEGQNENLKSKACQWVEHEETIAAQQQFKELHDLIVVQEDIETTNRRISTDRLETPVEHIKMVVQESLEISPKAPGLVEVEKKMCETSQQSPSITSNMEISMDLKEGSQLPTETPMEEKNDTVDLETEGETNVDTFTPSTPPDPDLSPVALRLLGNKHFAQQDWAGAIDLYTQATFKAVQATVQETKENMSPNPDKSVPYNEPVKDIGGIIEPESEVVMDYSNRAEAWLRLHHYERAWADSERALSLDPNHLKSLFRKGRALLGVGDYQQALAHFEAAYARAPFDKDILAAIELSQTADHQSRLGIYDLTNYYLRGRFVGEVPSCADYIGPVEVRATTGGDKGRGLFLTKPVVVGDLLLVSNPLAMVEFKSEGKGRKNILVSDSANPRLKAGVMENLVQSVRERAKMSSKNHQRLLALCHAEEGSPPQSVPPMDLFISGRREPPPEAPIESLELDDSLLQRIIAWNAIDRNMVSTTLEKRHVFQQEPLHQDNSNENSFCGLWVLPSFLNHSCIPNVSMVVIGRSLFVYASRDLAVGEELLCSYFNVFQPLPQRRQLASLCWGFTCKCARCALETRVEPSLKRLYSLHTRLEPDPTFRMQFSPFGYKALAKDLARELEVIESSKKLDNRERSWLQASFTQLYTVSRDFMGPHGNHPYLEVAFHVMELVCPGSNNTLEVGLLARECVRKELHGKKTSQYKALNKQLLRICKCIYGKHRTVVLQSLVDGTSPNVTRKT